MSILNGRRRLQRFWRLTITFLLSSQLHAVGTPSSDNHFLERSVTVDGVEYRYRVYVPPGWSKDAAWPVVLFLHGGGGYGQDGVSQTNEGLGPAIRRHPERFPALAVFPQVPSNGTPGWQQVGGRIAMAALDNTLAEFHGDPLRVVLTGLSIGGNGAWFLAYHHPERFAGLLIVCGFVVERMGTMYPILYPSIVPGATNPSAVVAQKVAHTPTWIFHGDADRTVSVENSRRMVGELRALKAPVQYTELHGVDHNAWDYTYDRPDVASWLVHQKRAAPDE